MKYDGTLRGDDTERHVGVQNAPPQNVPQWYTDYFELKAILASGSGEMSVCPPLTI